MQGMTITVTGGTQYDNSQLCSALQYAMQTHGFTNVSVDPASHVHSEAQDIISACRALNPDLFDTPISIEGTCEQDAIQPGSLTALTMGTMHGIMPPGYVAMPQVWPGSVFMGMAPAPLY